MKEELPMQTAMIVVAAVVVVGCAVAIFIAWRNGKK